MPSMKEILVVLLLRLAPLVLVYVIACKWLMNELAVPGRYAYWANLAGVLVIARVVAGPLFVRLHRADRDAQETKRRQREQGSE